MFLVETFRPFLGDVCIHCVMTNSISSSTIWIAKRAIGYDWLQSQLYIYIYTYMFNDIMTCSFTWIAFTTHGSDSSQSMSPATEFCMSSWTFPNWHDAMEGRLRFLLCTRKNPGLFLIGLQANTCYHYQNPPLICTEEI